MRGILWVEVPEVDELVVPGWVVPGPGGGVPRRTGLVVGTGVELFGFEPEGRVVDGADDVVGAPGTVVQVGWGQAGEPGTGEPWGCAIGDFPS